MATIIAGWEAAMAGFFDLTADVRVERLRSPGLRDALRAAPEDCRRVLAPCYGEWVVASSPTRPDAVGLTVRAASVAARQPPSDWLLDLVADDRLATEIQVPVVNRDRDAAATLATDPGTLIGLGDAGAHVMSVTGFSYPTYVLATLVRDEGRVGIERAVARLTKQPARFFGIARRGELRPGFAADVCVVDLDALEIGPLHVVHDLPGGAPRLFRGATGYRAVVVNGVLTLADDRLTGRRGGRAVRNRVPVPL